MIFLKNCASPEIFLKNCASPELSRFDKRCQIFSIYVCGGLINESFMRCIKLMRFNKRHVFVVFLAFPVFFIISFFLIFVFSSISPFFLFNWRTCEKHVWSLRWLNGGERGENLIFRTLKRWTHFKLRLIFKMILNYINKPHVN